MKPTMFKLFFYEKIWRKLRLNLNYPLKRKVNTKGGKSYRARIIFFIIELPEVQTDKK